MHVIQSASEAEEEHFSNFVIEYDELMVVVLLIFTMYSENKAFTTNRYTAFCLCIHYANSLRSTVG